MRCVSRSSSSFLPHVTLGCGRVVATSGAATSSSSCAGGRVRVGTVPIRRDAISSASSTSPSSAVPVVRRWFSTSSAAASSTAGSSFDIFAKLKDGTAAGNANAEGKEEQSKLKRKPSDKVLNLADQIMSLTLIEAADLCDLCQERLTPGDGSAIPGRMPFPHPMAMFGSGMMGGGMMGGGNMPAAMMGAGPQMGAAPQAAPVQPAAGAEAAPAGESGAKHAEKDAPAEKKKPAGPVALKLVSFEAAKKIAVIKEVRGLTALGLAQSKELVEGCPKVIKKGVPAEDAEKLIEKFKAAGGVVEIE